MFAIHPRLLTDCHLLGEVSGNQVLLHRNAVLPWLIVVPETGATELFTMDRAARERSLNLCEALSTWLLAQDKITKVNVGAIGNLVPQLHIHLVGRYPGDPCWPQPVWGNLTDVAAYASSRLETIAAELQQQVGLVTNPSLIDDNDRNE